ncbi:MAG: DUF4097 domain-containing protein [Clostridia bacterium]|nr:DUF4097 domain-containing protein [Clostridia bacterium]
MTGFQKLVKSFAILIAVCVVMLIIGVSIALVCILSVSTDKKMDAKHTEIIQGFEQDVEAKVDVEKPEKENVADASEIAECDQTGQHWRHVYEASEIESIEITNEIGKLRIESTDDPEILIEGENLSMCSSIELHGKKLYVKSMPERIVMFGVNIAERVDCDDSELVIYIPEGYELEKLSVTNNLGEVQIEDQSAKTIVFSNAVGSFEATGIKAEQVDLKGGVEDISIEMNANITDYDMKLIPGAGGIYVDGIEQEKTNHTNKEVQNRFTAEGAFGSIYIEFDPDD